MKNYALQFWLLAVAGWINREQQDVIAYLQEENRVYRECWVTGGRGSMTNSGVGCQPRPRRLPESQGQ